MADLLATASADKKNAEKEAREKAEREKKNEEDTRKMITEAGKKPDEWVNSVKKARQAMSCFVALLGNNPEEAKKHLGAVQGDKYTLARLHLRAGDQKKAPSLSEEAVKSGEKRVLPLLARIEILHAINRKDEAREAFDLLKPLSAHLDPQAPPIARVMKIAEEFSLGNWQASPVVRDDVGERPVLDTLGPVAWTPPAAHEFALPNEKGETISRKDYQGRPLVLIFYLGYGCLHCVEQLEEFAHKAELFEKAGFEVLAISTDSEGDLRKAKEKWEKEGGSFPFPLVADPAMHVFREWSAYDDFEKEPLHGTFVISRGGQVLWHDISSEPFMDCEFVVKEGKRLLQLHGRDL
jgi:peroxiredoxin